MKYHVEIVDISDPLAERTIWSSWPTTDGTDDWALVEEKIKEFLEIAPTLESCKLVVYKEP